jgi:glycosyltransferase involved in cell wall biosynthesis
VRLERGGCAVTVLSAAIIARNEEACIERCLKSLAGFDEIVVVDTGSTDATVEIAARYATVYTDYVWADDFAEARNVSLSRCNGDWILVIDCDEYLPGGMVEQIRALLEGDPGGPVDAFRMRIVWDEVHSHTAPRLYRSGLRFAGKVHEAITCVHVDSGLWLRYTASPTHVVDPDRNLRILLADHEDSRSLFYLAHEYQDRGKFAEALFWYERYLKVGTWRYELADANMSAAKCLWWLNRGDEARQHCLQAILGNPNFKEALWWMAEMSWEKERAVWAKFAEVADNSDVLFVRTV